MHGRRLGQVVGHVDAHPVTLTELDTRSGHLMVERVGQHGLVGQDPPLDHRHVEIEDLDSPVEASGQHLVALRVRRCAVGHVIRIDRGHVAHRRPGQVAGHDHPGRHDGAADIAGAKLEVGGVGRPQQAPVSATIEAIATAVSCGRVGRSAIGSSPAPPLAAAPCF